jgi:hypothetical protein
MDLGLDRRQFGDLVMPGLGILAAQRVSTAPAVLRLAVGDRGDALGRHQGPHPTRMSLLPAAATRDQPMAAGSPLATMTAISGAGNLRAGNQARRHGSTKFDIASWCTDSS